MYLHTEEVLDEVNALRVVLTRPLCARSHVLLTSHARPSWGTRALELANVVTAFTGVQTRRTRAVVKVHLRKRDVVGTRIVLELFV